MKIHRLAIVLLCFTSLASSQNYFDKAWKEVLQFEQKGLTKSAATQVEEIYAEAKSLNNNQQVIKSLLHKSKYILTLEEEAQLKIVDQFKAEINSSTSIAIKHLLENMLATMYWQYFQQNRFRFYLRSETKRKPSEDFRTWDLNTLFKEIHTYYQRSLENAPLLKQERLLDYKTLLIEAENSKEYRPTLYDLLCHNALRFYKTDENSITEPSESFSIENESYLASGKQFIDLEIISKDSTSLQLNALKIYQDLLRFHNKERVSEAFVNVDIERLEFIHQKMATENKTATFLSTLRESAAAIGNTELSGLYTFEIAKILNEEGSGFNSTGEYPFNTEELRWKRKEAFDLCSQVIVKFPNSSAAEQCKALKENILFPELQLQTEKFTPLQRPSRILVTYKNLEKLNLKILKISPKQLKTFNTLYKNEDRLAYLDKLSVYKELAGSLRNKGDFQQHSTELVVPILPNGLYLIKAEAVKGNGVFATTHIQITDFALIENREQEATTYQLVNRKNGKPIVGAQVTIDYESNTKASIEKQFKTNNYGKFSILKDDSYYRQISIQINHDKQKAHFGTYYQGRRYKDREEKNYRYNTFLFTDRSIYRPGQIVYFKGILTETEVAAKNTIVADDETLNVTLHDANGEQLSQLTLTSNDYGSVQGEFILPPGGLTGQYFIKTQSEKIGTGYTYFAVEEYKRPKFKAEFEPITETFRLKDSIKIKGKALAFAGSTITDAKVIYKVTREVQYPRWYYWRNPYWNFTPKEISYGEIQTDNKGEFEFFFEAIPDENVDKKGLPIFRYKITADVTDINGETRSATTIVNVGYHAMTLGIDIPEKLDKSQDKPVLSVIAKNLNNQEVSANGSLRIYKLMPPNRILRPRPWPAPDYQELSADEFVALFPNDPYNDEHRVVNWKRGKRVFSSEFDTNKSKTISLRRMRKWPSGKYVIEIESFDKFGQLVKDEKIVSVYSSQDKKVADKILFEATLNKASYKAGELVNLSIGSAMEDLTVTIEIEKAKKIISTHLLRLNNSKASLELPILADDLGGFTIHCSYAAYNSYGYKNINVNVPYPSTDLSITSKTFRDKLEPGGEETWSFSIAGPKGEKVAAELLASMYDASLDEFLPHSWNFNPIKTWDYYSQIAKRQNQSFGTIGFRFFNSFKRPSRFKRQSYDQLNWFGFYFDGANRMYLEERETAPADGVVAVQDVELEEEALNIDVSPLNEKIISTGSGAEISDKSSEDLGSEVQIRKNLRETAFFFPQLQTNAEGTISFNFKVPEALTKWKLQLLAHTKNLESTIAQYETVTQKELMVVPNTPRFLREGDDITISTKIANLIDKSINGIASLYLENALTGESITSLLIPNSEATEKRFNVDPKGNTQVSWHLRIPEGIQAIQYRIIAKTNDFSDGEQNILPVLSNRMLVTETLPLWIRSKERKTFNLEKLTSNSSVTLKHHKLTLELTSNPAWYAIQALPYLMEYPFDCNEQIFARYYANSMANHIITSNPRIESVFRQWNTADALVSNLEKNQELKTILIQETPWLRDAQSETEQKKRIALLFDLNKLSNELQSARLKLKNNQQPTGGWSWFNGGYDNRYITQHIVAGFGHLKHLGITQNTNDKAMVQSALNYLDKAFVKEFKDLSRGGKKLDVTQDHLSYMQLHYLYVRSFYPELKPSKEVQKGIDFYLTQIEKFWLNRPLYAKGLMALVMYRMNHAETANAILKSLEETSITSDELGMYWKENTNSWYWYKAPIETHALLIEAFTEIHNNKTIVDNLKVWLLKHKQTNRWQTTKATTEAIYALIMQGNDWLSINDTVSIEVGDATILPQGKDKLPIEAGTGYFKTSWTGSEIKSEMGTVTLNNNQNEVAWGGLYWQYFEDLDKITTAKTPLSLKKTLYLKSNSASGEVLSEIKPNTKLEVGDLVRVRIELKSDRPMEFIHLKDMRASGLEPVNVLSQYKWQDGFGYYESTKDASTNFFIDILPKGIYVFEYDLRVNNAGTMSNGISTIQSMYAPEFSSHSQGIRLRVE